MVQEVEESQTRERGKPEEADKVEKEGSTPAAAAVNRWVLQTGKQMETLMACLKNKIERKQKAGLAKLSELKLDVLVNDVRCPEEESGRQSSLWSWWKARKGQWKAQLMVALKAVQVQLLSTSCLVGLPMVNPCFLPSDLA